MELIRNLLIFIALLGGLVIFHELGHLLAAVWGGVKIREFGIGLPPRLLVLGRWHGIDITLNWIPLGGFIKPEGEFDPTVVKGLAASPAGTRIGVFAAGPLANLLAGYLVLVGGFATGWPEHVQVISVMPGYPAAAAGVQPDDVLIAFNGQPLAHNGDLTRLINENLGRPTVWQIQRGAQTLTLTITPNATASPSQPAVGLATKNRLIRYPWPAALVKAGAEVVRQVHETFNLPFRLIQGDLKPEEVRLSGVVGLKQVSDRVVENSFKWQELYPLLHLTAVVSIALGLTNILPLPALDGGRIAFTLLEIIRRKPVNARSEKLVHAGGLVALLGLMVFLIVQDFLHPLF